MARFSKDAVLFGVHSISLTEFSKTFCLWERLHDLTKTILFVRMSRHIFRGVVFVVGSVIAIFCLFVFCFFFSSFGLFFSGAQSFKHSDFAECERVDFL